MIIWEFINYKEYLSSKLGPEGSRTGLRKKLAEAIPVHTTFVTQVLKGRNEFSLEQAEAVNTFLNHSDEEGEYFILLILKERSTNQKLKKRFEKKIQVMRDERLNIQSRLKVDATISQKDREKFYSSAIYSAIHVLAATPGFQSIEALSEAMRLSKSRTREIVDFMIRIGILTEKDGKIISGSNHIHLGSDSELVLKHHINWRQFTINQLQFLDKDDIHYSACMSLSKKDAFTIKESILANLKKNVDIVSKSPEEEAFVMCLDFYRLVT